ncbi:MULTISPECIES: hypothetical protein [Nocardiopsis]|uniref:Uncharacterized protein n=1 Tax=Nocardiopsis lambiniae TaxID=3075539 RepID=A0ABU2MHQ6_9ACTN|nr:MULTISPECIES: hypothetical protein [unclassified Nocardiopsis]MDE3723651.1 hypothetical protein [Nocardiopsis sp. N85]MDT0332065.1 hypothetical protein [Nocardiopsis sp. DSM 44743]
MEGRNGVLMETGAYWLFYVVSVCGALMHWRQGNELLAAVCGAAAVLAALLIASGHRDNLAAPR